MTQWDYECDLLVVGSGAGGVSAAYTAAREGLNVILIEAADRFGGTTSFSGGGGVWFPANPVLQRGGFADDSLEEAAKYYHAVVGDRTPRALQEAYLEGGPKVIEYLETDPHIEFMPYPWPDYYGEVEGARNDGGRHMIPTPITAAELGEWHDQIRGTLDTERLGAPSPDLVVGGRALIGRFLQAIAAYDSAVLLRGTALNELISEEGRVVGAVVLQDGERKQIRASRGVILAAGGFEQNDDMRQQYGVPGAAKHSMGPVTNTGAAHLSAIALGASVDLMEQAWWSPGIVQPDGGAVFTLDFPGGIFVDAEGKRFVNESEAYDRAGRAVISQYPGVRDPRFWLIYDDRDGIVPPARVPMVSLSEPHEYESRGLWHTADTLGELAEAIGVPAEALESSVNRFNELVAGGTDEDFGRGELAYDTFFTDGQKPLVPIEQGPFHAAEFGLSDLGTKGGLRTDTVGRVLDSSDQAIKGLFATGNTMAAPSGETYPGGGNPIGTSLLFGHLAALTVAEETRAQATPAAEEIRARVNSYLTAVSARDGAEVASHYSEAAVIEDPVGGAQVSGIENITEFFSALSQSEHVEAKLLGDVRVAGNQAAFPFEVRIAGGGYVTTMRPVNVMTFDESLQVTDMKSFWNAEEIEVTPA